MKRITILFFVLLFSSISYAQIREDLPDPIEIYSKDQKRLLGLSNLMPKINNGKQQFQGKITRLKWFYEDNVVYFEIGKHRFEVGYANVSNVTRSYLDTLFKKNNRVKILAYAGGSNGIWQVISISRK